MPPHNVLALGLVETASEFSAAGLLQATTTGLQWLDPIAQASVVGGGDGDGDDDNVVQRSSQSSRPGLPRHPKFGASFSNIGPVPSAVRRVSVDGVKLSQALTTS